ncbi:MAG: hypothetical protein PHF37_09605 [Phycisphaerae bacterium]|nr:hypothetical protein [Phycisphaerae bacterium]
MHDRSSTKSNDFSPCSKRHIDWPYELVHAQAWVLPLGNYNPIEQAVIQILEEFKDYPPSIKEAADELEIMDSVFIESTLRQMVEKGTLKRIDTSLSLNFANCRINTGSLKEDNKPSCLEKQSVQFCFDAITSEHIHTPPAELNDNPANPVIEPDKLAAKRTHLGLDKSRQWAGDQREPFISESARIVEMTVLPDHGKYVWQPLSITCVIKPDGSLRYQLEQATDRQQQWLDQLDKNHPLFQKF